MDSNFPFVVRVDLLGAGGSRASLSSAPASGVSSRVTRVSSLSLAFLLCSPDSFARSLKYVRSRVNSRPSSSRTDTIDPFMLVTVYRVSPNRVIHFDDRFCLATTMSPTLSGFGGPTRRRRLLCRAVFSFSVASRARTSLLSRRSTATVGSRVSSSQSYICSIMENHLKELRLVLYEACSIFWIYIKHMILSLLNIFCFANSYWKKFEKLKVLIRIIISIRIVLVKRKARLNMS